MIKIAILGDIGAGKSFVASKFNLPVFNADKEVQKIYKYNKSVYVSLKKLFPKNISKFPINKKELINIIINNKVNINLIGKIIHPIVSSKLKLFIKKRSKKRGVILDIPLLVENKLTDKKTVMIYVDSKKRDIVKKLYKRKNFNKKIYKIMKNKQKSLNYKKKISRFIIYNNFNKTHVMNQIRKIKKELKI